MRVVFVINSLAGGGAEHSTVLLAQELKKQGHDIQFACLKSDTTWTREKLLLDSSEIPVHYLSHKKYAIRELTNIFYQSKPDIVHSVLYEADIITRCAIILLRFRTFGTAQTQIISSLVNTPYDPVRLQDTGITRRGFCLTWILDFLTAIFSRSWFHAVTLGVAKHYSQKLFLRKNKIGLIPRGRSEHWFLSQEKEANDFLQKECEIHSEIPPRFIVNIGRQDFQKGQTDTVHAFAIVQAVMPHTYLLFIGKSGLMTRRVNELVSFYNLQSNVFFLEAREDIQKILLASDALVISSKYEGTAGVALEAFATNTPVVSYDLDGVEGVLCADNQVDIFSDAKREYGYFGFNLDSLQPNAYLAPKNNPRVLATQMLTCLRATEQTQVHCENGLTYFQNNCSLSHIAYHMTLFYQQILDSRKM